jgi:hypothetical protein
LLTKPAPSLSAIASSVSGCLHSALLAMALAAPVVANAAMTIDTKDLPKPASGITEALLTPPGAVPPLPGEGDWEHPGAFRLVCNWSRMSFDDPLVYPNQPGAAHHHTFFGNTDVDAFSTTATLRTRGAATCRGGTINLSAYWVPSMVDTTTGKPVVPKALIVYYKTGIWTYMNDNSVIQPLPKGLQMIAGDSRAAVPGGGQFECFSPTLEQTRAGTIVTAIQANCEAGHELRTHLTFPQCWDGINLDSPDHKSHMAYPVQFWNGDAQRQYRCPATHPVVLPQITYNVQYTVPTAGATGQWRLSSDAYDSSQPGGYSLHGDWMDGWDPDVSDLWGVKCMRERRDCGSANLGDGRNALEFQGN